MAAKPMSRVELRINCNKLKKKDKLSKSDPCCVMYMKKDDDWTEVGRTETIMNNHDPNFARSFEIDYVFGKEQKIRFEVYDIDNKTSKLSDDDFLGAIDTTVEEVVSENPLTTDLLDKERKKEAGGTITLRAQEIGGRQDMIQLTFRAQKLENKDVVGKSDPFLEFCRKRGEDDWEVIHRTEVIDNNLNPVWRPIQLRAGVLSGGNLDNPIRIDCRDYDKNGKHELIGSFMTSVSELIKSPSGREWTCINPAKEKKKKYKGSGTVILISCESI